MVLLFENVVFLDGDNFCKAFAGATRDMTNSLIASDSLGKIIALGKELPRSSCSCLYNLAVLHSY